MERPSSAAVAAGRSASAVEGAGAGKGRGESGSSADVVAHLKWPRYNMSRCPVCRTPATKVELYCPDCRCAAYCGTAHRAEHLATGGHADECEALCAERLVRWRKAAEEGDAKAMGNLGIAYGFGYCRLAKDAAAGASWFKRAADLGNVESQFNLGCLYRDGEGVKQDFAESLRRYRQAAEQGHAGAQGAIGNVYFFGRGVPVNFERAVHYYRLGAKGGCDTAMVNLGGCYFNGEGVARSLADARKWFLRAKKAGYAESDEFESTFATMNADLAAAAAADGDAAAFALEVARLCAESVGAELIAEEEAEKAAAAAAASKAGKGKGKGRKGKGGGYKGDVAEGAPAET